MSSRRLRPGAMALIGLTLLLTGCTDEPITEPSPPVLAETATATSIMPSTSPTPTPSPTPSASPTPSPPPTPTPSPIASSTPSSASTAVPDDLSTITGDGDVTVAEAQAVIDIQTGIFNEGVTGLLTRGSDVTGGSGAEFNAALARIYTQGLLGAYGGLWNDIARGDFESFNTTDPNGITERVLEVTDVRADCFEVRVERDLSGLALSPIPPTTRWTSLVTREDSAAMNSTGWYRDVEITDKRNSPLCDLEPQT